LTLPALRKDVYGDYHSRDLRLRLDEVIQVRSAAIQAAVEAFQPDVFIVDKVPRGVADELMPTLEALRIHGTTRCVLGLREVIDEKTATLESWRATGTLDVVRRHFDAIWIYGDERVFNLVAEYELPHDVAAKVSFTGYLDQRQRADFEAEPPEWCAAAIPHDQPFVLCLVGGGQDGAPLAEAFVEAMSPSPQQGAGISTILVTGPFMPAELRKSLRRQASGVSHLRVIDFVPEADWLIRRAQRVVAMGGYNTACSILAFDKPALIVPRIEPRREQLVRARRLEALGLVDVLHPNDLRASSLRDWIHSELALTSRKRFEIDLNGLAAIPRLIHRLTCNCRPSQSEESADAHC
jgi:predicted glycosyltransferase